MGQLIGFIGGTGPEGRGLALRFVLAGERVVIGSRDRARAMKAVDRILSAAPDASVSGALNDEAVFQADPVFITVPYPAQRSTVEALKGPLTGKTVVVVTAPVTVRDGVAAAVPVPEGSAALEARAALPDSTVASAFQTISGRDLLNPHKRIESDVVVCADDPEARAKVMALAERIDGIRAINGGGLENAVYVENFTALLMNINKLYNVRSAIRITGIRPLNGPRTSPARDGDVDEG